MSQFFRRKELQERGELVVSLRERASVLECASLLALSSVQLESGRGLPHSRTLAR